MKRKQTEKIIITAVLTGCWLLMPTIGYENGDIRNVWPHVLYMFCHANIWHLAGNLFVLWLMRGHLHLLPSLAIASACSFIPGFSVWGEVGITIGFSGVLFAMAGIKWGVYCRWAAEMGPIFGHSALKEFLQKALPFALVGILIPHINWCIHLYSMIAGFAYGRCRR